MVYDRGALSLLCFLTCTSVLSLRIGGDNVWLLVCLYSIEVGGRSYN